MIAFAMSLTQRRIEQVHEQLFTRALVTHVHRHAEHAMACKHERTVHR